MGRLTPFLLALALSGCAAMTTVAAIPGVMVEGIVDMFEGQELSLPVAMHTALAASQQGLRTTRLDVDVLEPIKGGGYEIGFGNDKLNGKLKLTPQTPMLTTLDIIVRHGLMRRKSVEKTLLAEIQHASRHEARHRAFDFAGYGNIRAQPDATARRLGWFRHGAKLEVKASRFSGWLTITLPSGASGYLRGELPPGAGR